jgi:hypothetical protein
MKTIRTLPMHFEKKIGKQKKRKKMKRKKVKK